MTSQLKDMQQRDEYFRSACVSPHTYDRTIDWIKENNLVCKRLHTDAQRERFAVNMVHACIHHVRTTDTNFSALGKVVAVRASRDECASDCTGDSRHARCSQRCKRVLLCIELIGEE